MTDTVCPCCKGSRGDWQHFANPEALYEMLDSDEHVEGENCWCRPRFDPCLACHGSGELVGLARSILLARGDITPVQLRGHA